MNGLTRWLTSLRAYSFPASVVPVALAVAISVSRAAVPDSGEILWWTVPVYLAAALLFHAGTNVLNDYYDYRSGVDGPNDPDPTHAISRGIVTPRYMLVSGHIYFGLGVVLGTLIAVVRGPVFWAVGLTGALGAYLYTGRRFSLKYRGLGDLSVFVLMGPALVFTGVWAFTGQAAPESIAISVPVALLVTLILHGNNLRDITADKASGVRTVAGLLGFHRSIIAFLVLLFSAYASVALLIVLGAVPPLAGVVAISVPVALRLATRVRRARTGGDLMDLPVQSAGLHLLFGGVYAAALTVVPGLIEAVRAAGVP
jgi:1,4-dihydroxy-2-naphthoate octaprenyltransferase